MVSLKDKGNFPRIPRTSRQKRLYVIERSDGCCKVGISGRPKRRLYDFQNASPDRLKLAGDIHCSDASAAERGVKKFLKGFQIKGEWFSICSPFALAICRFLIDNDRAAAEYLRSRYEDLTSLNQQHRNALGSVESRRSYSEALAKAHNERLLSGPLLTDALFFEGAVRAAQA